MSSREVFIVSAARTPIGAFQGALSTLSAPDLGAVAIRGAIARAALAPEFVDQIFFGNVLTAGVGQAPARQASLGGGLPVSTPATTVGKVCGSGLSAVILGAQAIGVGDAEIVMAGGMESMSQAPYALARARGGYRLGHGELVDTMILDGLWDPYGDFHMGRAGETCASSYDIGRREQDDFARESYARALAANAAGRVQGEIVPVEVRGRGKATLVGEDEEPGRADLAKMEHLRPAFAEEGTITAANASKINDGAAALLLASEQAVRRHGLRPLARLASWGGHAQEPEWFTTAPVGAVRRCLEKVGSTIGEVDLFEINEAFSVVVLACARDLGIDLDTVNVRGGAVALGHPIGASGARILVTLLDAMAERDVHRGVASLCLGGGEALAVLVER